MEEKDNIVRPVEFIEPEGPEPGPPGARYSIEDEPLIESRPRPKKPKPSKGKKDRK